MHHELERILRPNVRPEERNPLEDDDDGVTVQVDREMIGVFDLPADELELVEEEVFSIDSKPEPTPQPEWRMVTPTPRRFDVGMVVAAGFGGVLGCSVAFGWWLAL